MPGVLFLCIGYGPCGHAQPMMITKHGKYNTITSIYLYRLEGIRTMWRSMISLVKTS